MVGVIARAGISLVCVLAVLPASAAAQPHPAPTWHLTVSAGGALGGDLNRGATAFGVSAGLPLKERLGVEAEVGFVSRIVAASHVTDAVTVTLSGNASTELRRTFHLIPYLTLGATLVRLGYRSPAPAEFGVNAGGGVLYAVAGDRIRLRGDLRFVHINNAPNFWRAIAGIVFRVPGSAKSLTKTPTTKDTSQGYP